MQKNLKAKKWLFVAGFLVADVFVLLLVFSFYQDTQVEQALEGVERNPSSFNLPEPQLGEVWGEKELKAAQYIAKNSVETAQKNQTGNFMRRDAHPKHHGCVKATLMMDPAELPEQYRHGLLSGQLPEKQAWVRFSNGKPEGALADDMEKDVRGMAVKIMGMPTRNGSHDLVMMTSPSFFSKNAKDYMKLIKGLEGGKLSVLGYMLTHPRNFLIVIGAQLEANNPLNITYHSAVPYKLGPDESAKGATAMRFKFVPCKVDEKYVLPQVGNDSMRAALETSVKAGETCFDFFVQPNTDLEKYSVEDPRKKWGNLPSYKVGKLTVLQDQNVAANFEMCENLSFNPWNSLPQNRPLGQVNRIREVAYIAMSDFRHKSNQKEAAEPVDFEPCTNPRSSSLCK